MRAEESETLMVPKGLNIKIAKMAAEISVPSTPTAVPYIKANIRITATNAKGIVASRDDVLLTTHAMAAQIVHSVNPIVVRRRVETWGVRLISGVCCPAICNYQDARLQSCGGKNRELDAKMRRLDGR